MDPYSLLLTLTTLSMIINNRQKAYDDLALEKNKIKTEYDYIIIGAGSAGATVASRLSEENVTVLLLEAGGPETVITSMPSMGESLQQSKYDWNYTIVPQNKSCFGIYDNVLNWPRGKLLGGTSSINRMVYLRGSPNDFDNWEKNHGAKGWSWNNVLKYFIKFENNTDPNIANNGYHGNNGPVTITTPSDVHPLIKQWIYASTKHGYPQIDLNADKGRGTAITQRFITNGIRVSSAYAYLLPYASKRTNLHIITKAFATKFVFKNNRAIGIQYLRDGNPVIQTVYARKEIIVSAGTINSPQLLILSVIS